MAIYKPAVSKDRIFTFKVPSSPGCWIKGPGTPRWNITKAVDGMDSDVQFQDALLQAWLLHPETEWNLEIAKGKPLDRTPETIGEYLDTGDINELMQELTKRLFPTIYALMQNMYQSAEGNELQALMQSLTQSSETTFAETPTEKASSSQQPEETQTSMS